MKRKTITSRQFAWQKLLLVFTILHVGQLVSAQLDCKNINHFKSSHFGALFVNISDHRLFGWGRTANGLINNFPTSPSSTELETPYPIQAHGYELWTNIYAGYNFAFGRDLNGDIWGWGLNSDWQLGDFNPSSTYEYPEEFISLKAEDDAKWLHLSPVIQHTLGVQDNGTLWGWGNNANRLIANSAAAHFTKPRRIGENKDWKFVASSETFALVINLDGRLYAWGENDSYGIGIGGVYSYVPIPQNVDKSAVWDTIVVNQHTIAGIQHDGSLWIWGRGTNGELGNGTFDNSSLPIKVELPSKCKSVALGANHVVALTIDGEIMVCIF